MYLLHIHTHCLIHTDFIISNDSLFTNKVFNFEELSSTQVHIKTTNSNGFIFDKYFSLSIVDKDEIYDILLDNNTLPENKPEGYVIGSFSINDQNTSASATSFEILDT